MIGVGIGVGYETHLPDTGGAPPATFHLLTEAGDELLTEAGDNIDVE